MGEIFSIFSKKKKKTDTSDTRLNDLMKTVIIEGIEQGTRVRHHEHGEGLVLKIYNPGKAKVKFDLKVGKTYSVVGEDHIARKGKIETIVGDQVEVNFETEGLTNKITELKEKLREANLHNRLSEREQFQCELHQAYQEAQSEMFPITKIEADELPIPVEELEDLNLISGSGDGPRQQLYEICRGLTRSRGDKENQQVLTELLKLLNDIGTKTKEWDEAGRKKISEIHRDLTTTSDEGSKQFQRTMKNSTYATNGRRGITYEHELVRVDTPEKPETAERLYEAERQPPVGATDIRRRLLNMEASLTVGGVLAGVIMFAFVGRCIRKRRPATENRDNSMV